MSKIATQVTIMDGDTGEVIKDVYYRGTQNGDGWMIVYRDSFMNFLLNSPDFVTTKVFGSLMTKQNFDSGIKITKKFIADELKVSYRSVMNAFKWLKEHDYVKEHKVNGVTEFLLNPDVTTCGKKKEEKVKLWNSI